MSALTTVAANLARQKAYNVAGNKTGTTAGSGASVVYYALKGLFLFLAANKGNPDLEFKSLPGSSNEGLVDTACTLYGLYLRKGTTATSAFYKISNHATQVQASSDVIVESHLIGEDLFLFWPQGHTLTTGMACGSYTAYNGSNVTTASTAGDQLSGFALVGA